MADQKTDATGITPIAPSYEEALKQTAARRVAGSAIDGPVPDNPRGAPHLNPAINPAPPKIEVPERIPVPVINDPGLVGANPPLHELNKAYMSDILGGNLPDQSMGMTADKQRQAIKDAAQSTQDAIAKQAADDVAKATDDAVKTLADPPKKADAKGDDKSAK